MRPDGRLSKHGSQPSKGRRRDDGTRPDGSGHAGRGERRGNCERRRRRCRSGDSDVADGRGRRRDVCMRERHRWGQKNPAIGRDPGMNQLGVRGHKGQRRRFDLRNASDSDHVYEWAIEGTLTFQWSLVGGPVILPRAASFHSSVTMREIPGPSMAQSLWVVAGPVRVLT